MKKKITLLLLLAFVLNPITYANTYYPKYPSISEVFLGEDKYEKFNRRVFDINLKMNRVFVRNVHVLWASLVPNFIIDSLNRAYSNIEYPKRLISCLLQKDKEAALNETKRFLINTTLGLAGLLDSAYKIFNLELYDEDMEQAFAKCKVKCGSYLVLPFVSSTSSRDIIGRIFDFLLNPTTYISSPITAAIKFGLLINRTTHIQPMVKMVESNFADPYDIARKFWGVVKYIKLSNYDRKNVLAAQKDDYDEIDLVNKERENLDVRGKIKKSENLIVDMGSHDELSADITLDNYNPQSPIADSMRTALFGMKNKKVKFWDDMAIWNRDFSRKIKTAQIEIIEGRPKYTVKYVLQKDKASPLMIIFPSFAEGVNSSHSAALAQIFYEKGYSVLILGSHFQWEFLKSIEKGYKLGNIHDDIKYIEILIDKTIRQLAKNYDRIFLKRVAFGTSLGAYSVLYLASRQYENNSNNIDKFIAVCPPYDLIYSTEQMDKIMACWKNYPDDFSKLIAKTTAKVMRAYDKKSTYLEDLPFSNYEAKLISAYIFEQKLSDLIYQTELENNPETPKKQIYSAIYETNYKDYIEKYLTVNHTLEELSKMTSLSSISNYLIYKDNYKIFHSLDDYLINQAQLKELKSFCGSKLTLFSNGAHLGFLYRDEFIEALKKEI